jgi:hypothetical protein
MIADPGERMNAMRSVSGAPLAVLFIEKRRAPLGGLQDQWEREA